MRKTLFLALTLLLTLSAAVTTPRAAEAACGWRCICDGHALCTCPGGPPACGEPRPTCPVVPC